MEDNLLYASALKAYATPTMLWRFLRDGAAALRSCHAEGRAYGRIALDQVVVEEEDFRFAASDGSGDTAQDVWRLAAACFHLATGFVLFDGRPQREATPIPMLRHPELQSLGELLCTCLAFDPRKRPSAETLESSARAALEGLEGQERPRRSSVAASPRKEKAAAEYDRRWPEAFLIVLICLLFLGLPARAQSEPDAQTRRLIEVSLSLRKGGEAVWTQASQALEAGKTHFTLMDELIDREHECYLLPSRLPCFGINRIIREIKDGDIVQTTGKDFKDGTDPRFGYALIEKGVKAGQTAVYDLMGRSGEQFFAVIPYDPKQAYRFAVHVDSACYEGVPGKDGMLLLTVPAEAGLPGATAWIELENQGSRDASFILINDKRGNR